MEYAKWPPHPSVKYVRVTSSIWVADTISFETSSGEGGSVIAWTHAGEMGHRYPVILTLLCVLTILENTYILNINEYFLKLMIISTIWNTSLGLQSLVIFFRRDILKSINILNSRIILKKLRFQKLETFIYS